MLRKKENKGITLIALVVTIIVLLILAGVSISMLTGDNGILKRAQEAKEKTEEAVRKERADLDRIDELIGEATSNEKTVEQVTDKNPGQLEEESEVKVINSIEDLVVFADSVTKGRENYDGQTVKLGLSLDFNSSKSYVNPYRIDYGNYGYNGELKTLLTSGEGFKPIGITTNENGYEDKSFKGTFDGNGKVIKNLYIDKEVEGNEYDVRIGLFGSNLGEIKNLGLEECNINGKLTSEGINTGFTGGIAGVNRKNIKDCFVSGKIFGEGANSARITVGGIVGQSSNNTEIMDSYNMAFVNVKLNGVDRCYLGGIAGAIGSESITVENCFNAGLISANVVDAKRLDAGGLIGLTGGVNVRKCYNIGNILKSGNCSEECAVGGAFGLIISLNVEKCYSISEIQVDGMGNETVGLFVAKNHSNGGSKSVITDCSCLKFQDFSNIKENDGNAECTVFDSKEYMPSILEVLGNHFKQGTRDYPILSWQ